MWGRYALERKLADMMGFDYCTLFDTARSAMKAVGGPRYMPSNVCPILRELFPRAVVYPVNSENGLCAAPFQLYGYRQEFRYSFLEIDPHMTGFLRAPCAANVVISFGRKKMLDISGGGALLSNEIFKGKAFFPEILRGELQDRLKWFNNYISHRWAQVREWDRLLGDSCIRIPQEQIMPWRIMRRIPENIDESKYPPDVLSHAYKLGTTRRDAVVARLREQGYAVGTNYPPLPGVTDAGAIQWGREVINFFPEEPDIRGACESIKRVLDGNVYR